MASESKGGDDNLVELPANFVEVARSVGIDPHLLAELMLSCISAFMARKLALFSRRG